MEIDTVELLEAQYKEELSVVENEWKPLLEELQKALGTKLDKPEVSEATRMKLNELFLTAKNRKYDAECAVNEKYRARIEMEIGNLEGECNEKCRAITKPIKEPYDAKIWKLEKLKDKYWPSKSYQYGGCGI